MHTCDNVHQTHELTCVIGPADAHSHLRKSATWKLVWRGLPVCQETRTVNSAFHLRTVKPEGKNDFLRSHFQQTTQPVGTQNKAQLMFRRIFQPPSLWFSGCSRKNLPQVTLGKWYCGILCSVERDQRPSDSKPLWLLSLRIKIKHLPSFPLETLKTAKSLAVFLIGWCHLAL